MSFLKRLNGSKTYIGVIAAGVVGFIISMGWATWDDQVIKLLTVVIATWTGVAITHKANKFLVK